jgi:hypothetical protein
MFHELSSHNPKRADEDAQILDVLETSVSLFNAPVRNGPDGQVGG